MASHRGDDWYDLILRRCLVLCPDSPPPNRAQINVLRDKLCALGKAYGAHSAFYVIKAFSNGWGTTSRYQEDYLWPCIMGCEGARDASDHYVCCYSLWSMVAEACSSSCESSPRDPICRLCLTDPSPDSLLVCSVATWLYHALKIGHRDEVEELITLGDFAGVRTLAEELLSACPEIPLTV